MLIRTLMQNRPCELVLEVLPGQYQLSEQLRSSEAWLVRNNPLAGDIESRRCSATGHSCRNACRSPFNGAPSAHLVAGVSRQ